MDTRGAAESLGEAIWSASRNHFRPLPDTATVIVHALRGEPVDFVVAEPRELIYNDEAQVTGHLVVATTRFLGFVELDRATLDSDPYPMNDGGVRVSVVPRSWITDLTLTCPGLRRDQATFDFEELPAGSEVTAYYRNRDEPLVIRGRYVSAPLRVVQAMLLEDLAASR